MSKPTRRWTEYALAAELELGLAASNIFSLDDGRPLTDRNAIRGTCYAEKLEKLSPADRLRVERMEELLYQRRLRATSCTPGALHLPDSCFDCVEGSIWYHYSIGRKLFILADFELKHRGSGWSGSGGCFVSGGRQGIGCGAGEGIAAALAEGLHAARLGDGDDRALVAQVAMQDTLHPGVPRRTMRLVADLRVSHRVFFHACRDSALPDWSLLGQCTRTQEELGNAYARSIFAGEALCRISMAIGSGTHPLKWAPLPRAGKEAGIRAPLMPRPLLAECMAILRAIRDGKASRALTRRARHYVTASLMDRNMLADMRRLALIRSEMTFRLASALSCEVEARRARATPAEAPGELLRKYALLCEFARLSERYFGTHYPVDTGIEVLDDLGSCGVRGRPIVHGMVRDLHDFGHSTSLVVEEFVPAHGGEPVTIDMSALHDRLGGIAGEILLGHRQEKL